MIAMLLPFKDIEHSDIVEFSISGYSVEMKIEKKGSFKKYVLSVLKKGNKKFFAKTSKNGFTRNAMLLKKEANIYKILSKSKINSNIKFPEFQDFVKNEKTSTLLLQQVKGQTLSSLDDDTKIAILNQSIQYIRLVGDKLSKDDKKIIGKRTSLNEVFLFLLLFPVTVINNISNIALLIKSAIKFLKLMPDLLKEKKLVLTHRDLHGNNILIGKNKIWLFDFENLLFTLPSMEYVIMILSYWRNRKLRKYLMSIIKDSKAAKALLIKMAIHYLTDKNMPESKRQDYIGGLKWAVK